MICSELLKVINHSAFLHFEQAGGAADQRTLNIASV
jgi:hypothetical protein